MDDRNAAIAREIITSNVYMSLGTAGERPWIAPVFYAYDDEYIFYFVSAVDSMHVQQLLKNHQAAAAIYSTGSPPGEGNGVQMDGYADVVGEADLPRAIATYYTRRFPNIMERAQHNHVPQDFLGDSFRRIVSLVPAHVYILDPAYADGDRRIEVSLT